MAKLFGYLFLMTAVFAVSVSTMIFGWGLEVQNWGWVIGGYIAVVCISSLTGLLE